MAPPFIFIATNRLRPGALDRERARVPELAAFIESSEPQVIAFNEYVNAAGDEVSVVQVHPDAASFERHLGIVAERARDAYAATVESTVRIQVFGEPTERILRLLREQAGDGVEVLVDAEHLGGFTRTGTEPK